MIREELPYVERVDPDLVSILIGVNDLVQGRPPKQYRESPVTIYDAVQDRTVVAVSIPTWSYVPAAADFGGRERVERLTKVFNDVALDEATSRGFTWVDIGDASTAGIGTEGWIAADQLHPGDAQYSAWATVILGAFLRARPELASR